MKHLYKHTHCLISRVLLVAFIIVMLAAGSVFAAESDLMPALEDRSGSLNLNVLYTDGDVTKPIDGFEFSIYKVADVRVDNGSVLYTSTSDFASAGINYEGMSASESMDHAKTLEQIAEESEVSSVKAVSDGNGVAPFSDLSLGMYLISQTGASGQAVGFEEIDPFLILVPAISDDMQWIYDVEAFPKPTLVKIPEPETETTTEPEEPKTGDESNITLWITLFGAAIIVIAVLLFVVNRKRNE